MLLFLLFSLLHWNWNKEDGGKTVEFYLSPCFDVLEEVLRFGGRRRLAKLERVGRRFHRIIEQRLQDVPFLRLDLQLEPRYSHTGA